MLLKKIADSVKNIWFLVATISASTAAVLVFIEENSTTISEHDVEIGVGLFSVLFITMFIVYSLMHSKFCRVDRKVIKVDEKVDLLNGKMDAGFNSIECVLLIADINDFYKEHIGKESLTLLESKQLHKLDERRIRLGVNSHIEDMVKRLASKPVRN